MSEANNRAGPDSAHMGELARFQSIRLLHNHWSRPIGPRSYYWYLTFEDSAELHHLAAECQEAIAFPYYDLTPLRDLHLTLDRIAFEDRITSSQLTGVEAAATRACQKIQPFDITIGALGGTPGAIGLTAFPAPATAGTAGHVPRCDVVGLPGRTRRAFRISSACDDSLRQF